MPRPIDLDETECVARVEIVPDESSAPQEGRNTAVDIAWEHESRDSMILYLSEEPEIGHEFDYNGVRWQIVDYRNGWIAKLLVD